MKAGLRLLYDNFFILERVDLKDAGALAHGASLGRNRELSGMNGRGAFGDGGDDPNQDITKKQY